MALPRVSDGELAIALHVQRVNDFLSGGYVDEMLIKGDSTTDAAIRAFNIASGGRAIAAFKSDGVTQVFLVDNTGIAKALFGNFIDIAILGAAPAAPGAATGLARLYFRGGAPFIKVEGGGEQPVALAAAGGADAGLSLLLGGM